MDKILVAIVIQEQNVPIIKKTLNKFFSPLVLNELTKSLKNQSNSKRGFLQRICIAQENL